MRKKSRAVRTSQGTVNVNSEDPASLSCQFIYPIRRGYVTPMTELSRHWAYGMHFRLFRLISLWRQGWD
jgi:hypothetical protein